MRRFVALEKIAAPVVSDAGYSFEGLQYFPQGKRSLIRVFIDQDKGITADDCQKVSNALNTVFGVEAGLPMEYTLEVSSPGLDRLLFTEQQLLAQVGKQVAVKLLVAQDGRKKFKGAIVEVADDRLVLSVDEEETISLTVSEIDEARLVPEW